MTDYISDRLYYKQKYSKKLTFWVDFKCNNVAYCKISRTGGGYNMKGNVKKCMLEAVRKTVKASAGNGDSLFCPVIFHQPKPPEKSNQFKSKG